MVYTYNDEMDELTLIRFELHIPGIESSFHRKYWMKFSEMFQRAAIEYSKEVGRTSRGRRFKEISNELSHAVVPY